MSRKSKSHPDRMEVSVEEISAIVERTQTGALSAEEHAKLKAAIDTFALITAQLQAKDASVDRLRRMIFGATTESTRNVLGEKRGEPTAVESTGEDEIRTPRPKPPGHGRNAAAAYTGASQVTVAHPTLHGGEACPGCESGKLYPQNEPAKLVRITGMAPLSASVYSCDRLRCNLCGEVFTAPAPEGVGNEKYDATATSMVGLLKYGAGLPFNRIEKLQESMGIPLPAATQWDLVQAAAKSLAPVHGELLRQAAQGRVIYNDDTTMKVLQLTRKQRAAALADDADGERTGIFTSGIVATGESHQIALFFTGPCPPQLRSARTDPDVRWLIAQHPERVRHDPVSMPGPCPAKICGTDRDVPGRSPLRARNLARGLHHRCTRARTESRSRATLGVAPEKESAADDRARAVDAPAI
jgi:transposase